MNPTAQDVLHALEHGKISEREADAYLRATHKTTLRTVQGKKHIAMISIILIAVAAMITGLIYLPGGLTGLVTLDTQENATSASHLLLDPVTRLRASGTMYGEGEARLLFQTDTGTLTITTIRSDTGAPRTAQASYAPGAEVILEHAEGASVYLDDGATTTPLNVPFAAPAIEGTYELLIVQDLNGTPATHRTPLIVSAIPLERTTTFANACEETCVLEGLVGTVELVTQGVRVDYTLDGTSATTNAPPQLTQGFTELLVTENTTIDLSEHFIDPEGEALLYSTSTSELATMLIEGEILTIVPVREGRETIIIYASDLNEIVQAQFDAVISPPRIIDASVNETNATENETIVDVNETTPSPIEESPQVNTTGVSESNATLDGLDCTNPNPNERPLACLQENSSEYFTNEDIYWTNLDRQPVAKLNELGNILITGDVIEYSSTTPGSRDFVIGMQDRDGNTVASVWIDSEGNLHARGAILEEQLQISPPPGTYSVLTRRSIYLAYVDYGTGNLYVRGNVIPYRRQI